LAPGCTQASRFSGQKEAADNIYGHELTPTPTADWESNTLEKLKFCVKDF